MIQSLTTTAPGPPAAPGNAQAVRLAGASMVGTTLEWYDFTVYNTMAALAFNRLFFPSVDPLAGVILAFSTYAVGYLSRPLGGIVFGGLGDRIGRRAVLVLTLVLMGLTTTGMGLLPTYEAVGVAAPVLLVALRFVQGVALGGEWAGAVLLSMEHGRQDRRGLNASWTQMGPALGIILATTAIALLTTALSDAQFIGWGWRVPFVASLLLVVFGLWVRRGVEESPMFEALEAGHQKAEAPVGEVLTRHWRRLLIAGGCRIGTDVQYTLAAVFSLTYVTTVLKLPSTVGLIAVLCGAVVNAACVPLCGLLSDRFGRRPVYGLGVLGSALWAFPFFTLLDTKATGPIILALVVGYAFHAAMYGPQGAFITEQFRTPVRYTGSSLAYTFAGVVGGGFAPLIIAALFQYYGTTAAVSVYVIVALLVTTASLLAARETAGKPLEE